MSSDVKPLLTSCLALGNSLLETYLPDGNRRPSSDSEFANKVQDFFTHASCSKYGSEMFNKYKDSNDQRENIFTRNSASGSEVIFHKINPLGSSAGSEVIKTKANEQNSNGKQSSENLFKIAQQVVKSGLSLDAQKSVEAGSEDNLEKQFPS